MKNVILFALLCGCSGTGFVTVSSADCDGTKHGRSVTYVGYKGTEAVYDRGQLVQSTVFDRDGRIEREMTEGDGYELDISENVEQVEPAGSN